MIRFIRDNTLTLLIFISIIMLCGGFIFVTMDGHWKSNPDTPHLGALKFCISQEIVPQNIFCSDSLQSRYYQQCAMSYQTKEGLTKDLDLLCPVVGSSNIGCVRVVNDSH